MKNKLFNNAVWIVGCKLIRSVLALVITMITARYLGPTNYGTINYAAGLVAFAAPLMKLGLSAIMVRELVDRPQDEGKIVGTVTGLNLMSSFLCIVGVTAFSAVANAGEWKTIVVCAIYSILLMFQALEMVQYWFQAKLMSKYSSIAVLAAYVCSAVFQIFLVAYGKSVYWFAASYSVEYGVLAILLLVIYHRAGGQSLSFDMTEAKRLLSIGRYYILAEMMVIIFSQTDRIMLKLMIGSEAVGYYATAVTCANIFGFVFAAIIDSARPVIMEKRQKSKEDFEQGVAQLYSVIFYLALTVSAAITIFSPLIIRIMYGAEYMPAVAPLRLIVWYITFSLFGSVRNVWILGEGLQKKLWKINICGALVNVVFNAILIPVWGVLGAALTSLVTQFFTNVIIGFIYKPIRRNNILMLRGVDFRLFCGITHQLLHDITNRSNESHDA